jgi:hypothetical protein
MAADWSLGGAPRTAALVSVVTLLGLVAAFANGLPALLQWLAGLLALLVGVRGVMRLIRPNVAALAIDEHHLTVRQASGRRLGGPVVSAFVSPLFVGLRWRPEHSRWSKSLGIFSEQMSPEDFRRLSAALRRAAGA